jgi:hypothetical protein
VLERHRAFGYAILRLQNERLLRVMTETEVPVRLCALLDADVDERSIGKVKLYLKHVACRLRLSLSETEILQIVDGDPYPPSETREH